MLKIYDGGSHKDELLCSSIEEFSTPIEFNENQIFLEFTSDDEDGPGKGFSASIFFGIKS